MHVLCCCCCWFFLRLHCPLRLQNSPQTCLWEGFLLFGKFSFFRTPSLTLLSLFLSFIFCPTSFRWEWAAFLGALCPLPAFRNCSVKVAQHSNDLLMNFLGRKWYSHPIPPPSLDCHPPSPLCPPPQGSILDWVIMEGLIRKETFKLRPKCQERASLRKIWIIITSKQKSKQTLPWWLRW